MYSVRTLLASLAELLLEPELCRSCSSKNWEKYDGAGCRDDESDMIIRITSRICSQGFTYHLNLSTRHSAETACLRSEWETLSAPAVP